MKYLVILVVLMAAFNMAKNALNNPQLSETELKKYVEELNKKMPVVNESLGVRIERVEYANRKMTSIGRILEGQILDDQWNKETRSKLTAFFCSHEILRKANVTIAYSYDQIALRSLNDKIKRETFSGEVSPSDCKG